MEGVTCSLCSPGRAGWCPWSGRWDFPHTLGTYSAGHSQCHRVPAGDRTPRAEPPQGCASWPPPPPGAGGCAGEGCDPCGSQGLWGHGGGSPCLTLPLQQPEGKDLCCCYWCAWYQAALGLPLLFAHGAGTIPGTLARGDALTGIRPEERHLSLRKHAGLDCTRLDLHPKSVPWDQGNALLFPLSPGSAPGWSLPPAPFLALSGLCLSPDPWGAVPAGEPWLFGGPWFSCSGAGRCFLLHSLGYWARDTSKEIGFSAPCERELEGEGLGGFSIVPARWRQLGLFGV